MCCAGCRDARGQINYARQRHTPGSGARPDFTFFIPGTEQELHLDSKFPMEGWRSDARPPRPMRHARQAASCLCGDIKRLHIKTLARPRLYSDPAQHGRVLPSCSSLIRACSLAAVEADPDLIKHRAGATHRALRRSDADGRF